MPRDEFFDGLGLLSKGVLRAFFDLRCYSVPDTWDFGLGFGFRFRTGSFNALVMPILHAVSSILR